MRPLKAEPLRPGPFSSPSDRLPSQNRRYHSKTVTYLFPTQLNLTQTQLKIYIGMSAKLIVNGHVQLYKYTEIWPVTEQKFWTQLQNIITIHLSIHTQNFFFKQSCIIIQNVFNCNWYVTFYMFKFSVAYNHAQKQTNLNKQLHNITIVPNMIAAYRLTNHYQPFILHLVIWRTLLK